MKLKKELKLPKAATLEGIHNEKEVWHQYTIRALGKKKKPKKQHFVENFPLSSYKIPPPVLAMSNSSTKAAQEDSAVRNGTVANNQTLNIG